MYVPNDRFHVQQLMSETVDQLRIHYRWKVLDAENLLSQIKVYLRQPLFIVTPTGFKPVTF